MKIKFMPMDITIEGDPNKSILQLAWANKIEIKSICKGIPSCSECRINIKDGDNSISPPTKEELNLIGTSYFLDGRRLACQVRCYGDVVVDMTEQVGRVDGQAKKIRGYRVQKGQETTAVNDTFILDAKPADTASFEGPDPAANHPQHEPGQSGQPAPQNRPKQHQNNQNRGQQKQGQGNQQRQGQQRNQNQGQRQGGQGGGGKRK